MEVRVLAFGTLTSNKYLLEARMRKMLLLELKNCLNRKEFKFIASIMLLISIGSFLFTCFEVYGWNMTAIRSAYEMGSIQWPSTDMLLIIMYSLIPLLASIIYSDTYFTDVTCGVYKFILTRTDKRSYVWAKAIVNFGVAFSVFFIPLLLNQLLCFVAFPPEGFDSRYAFPPYDIGVQHYDPAAMFDLIRLQHPALYNLLFIFLISLVAALFALLTYSIFFIGKKGRFAAIVGVFLLYIIGEMIVSSLGSYRLSLINLLQAGNTGSFTAMLLWLSALLAPSITIITIKTPRNELGVER